MSLICEGSRAMNYFTIERFVALAAGVALLIASVAGSAAMPIDVAPPYASATASPILDVKHVGKRHGKHIGKRRVVRHARRRGGGNAAAAALFGAAALGIGAAIAAGQRDDYGYAPVYPGYGYSPNYGYGAYGYPRTYYGNGGGYYPQQQYYAPPRRAYPSYNQGYIPRQPAYARPQPGFAGPKAGYVPQPAAGVKRGMAPPGPYPAMKFGAPNFDVK